MHVKNRSCIRRLSLGQLRASKVRNWIAVFAIALTTVLFTALFTIVLSINDGFQQSNFRQCGGWSHATFKYMTQEQYAEIRDDTLIKSWGLRRFVGMPNDAPFLKSHVEVGYSDAAQAHFMYCDPIVGSLPREGTQEAATDTHVLSLLGVEPELGKEFTITFDVDGHTTTQTFLLSGWWEYDEAIVANHVLIPQSRAEEIFDSVGVVPGQARDGMTGTWNLDVMFPSSLHIARDVQQVLSNHGYQDQERSQNYVATGINWGYSGSQLAVNLDASTVLAIGAMLALIIFTGYLIIYNVFQISVGNDIRFYGLLKTIGTTPRQLGRMIRYQAMYLSLAGIPLGLVGGWLVGRILTPVVIGQLDGIVLVISVRPGIFLVSALFSLLTVLLSCRRPGRLAARVSPVEAVRYTEGRPAKGRGTRSSKPVSLPAMAWANLGRSRGKTTITIVSLSLAVVLLNLTVTFTRGFDMDKYLSSRISTDYVVADAGYFQTNSVFHAGKALPQATIEEIQALGITDGGRVCGLSTWVQEGVTEEYYRQAYGHRYSQEQLDTNIQLAQRRPDGTLLERVQLYGMDDFILSRLRVLEGDMTAIYTPGSNAIAAVYSDDDYGQAMMDSHWAKVGDTVTLRYVDAWECYNPLTGEVYPDGTDLDTVPRWAARPTAYREVDYTVAALVVVPYPLSYRYFGRDEFVMNHDTFCRDTGTEDVMLYAFDTADDQEASMDRFLADYTQKSQLDFESKATYASEFEGFRSMFNLLGGALSFLVGLVGVLNFFNAIFTGIVTRRREFAMLQSVGMTGRQLKTMLVWEGLYYTLGSGAVSVLAAAMLEPLTGSVIESTFWFFSYRFTLWPVLVLLPVFLILGATVPLVLYPLAARETIVERLREAEA